MAAARRTRAGRPTKGWFRRCVDAVNREGSAFDPEAVCGAMLRRKVAAGYRPRRRARRGRKAA